MKMPFFGYFRIDKLKAAKGRQYLAVAAAALSLIIVSGMLGVVLNSTLSRYIQKNLSSDAGNVAETVNPGLINPWGIAASPSGQWWIAVNSKGAVIAINREGISYPVQDPLKITVPTLRSGTGLPSTPTGVVFNRTADFVLARGKPARLIIATEDGTLAAWNPEVEKDKAILLVDNSSMAVYKGVTIGSVQGKRRIYAANFSAGTVDVFDTYFHQLQLQAGAFMDTEIPDGYAPFNVQQIGGRIYVAYAMQDGRKHDPVRAAGLGFVTVFDGSGTLITRLKSGPELNAPWGMALAPPEFGRYSSMLLVGNSGNGTIAAYDAATGEFEGLLEGMNGGLVTVEGLRGIAVRADRAAGSDSELYFCAGIKEGEHGLFGMLRPAPE